MTRLATALASALLCFASQLAAQDSVHVVDPSGAGDFTTITSAVGFAADGDLILVRAGTYGCLKLDGSKGVTIQASGPGAVNLTYLEVSDLASHLTVAVRGLTLDGLGCCCWPSAGIVTKNCAGEIWIEDCFMDSNFPTAVRILHSDAVVFANTFVAPSIQSVPAVRIESSTVFIADSELVGFHPSVTVAVEGGTGLSVLNSTVFVTGGRLVGGKGGLGSTAGGSCIPAGAGGPAIRVDGVSSVELLGVALEPGAGGPGGPGCPDGPEGPEVDLISGTAVVIPDAAPVLRLDSPGVGGDLGNLTIQSQPGDLTWLVLSPDFGQPMSLAAFLGTAAVEPPVILVPFGVVPDSGTINASVLLPELGPGVHLSFFGQVAAVRGATALVASASHLEIHGSTP